MTKHGHLTGYLTRGLSSQQKTGMVYAPIIRLVLTNIAHFTVVGSAQDNCTKHGKNVINQSRVVRASLNKGKKSKTD